jgi:hypothetical protein
MQSAECELEAVVFPVGRALQQKCNDIQAERPWCPRCVLLQVQVAPAIRGSSTEMPDPFPEPLRYLQPFIRALSKLAPADRNEDVDPSRLETALRKRVRNMDGIAAEAALASDRKRLETWLKTFGSPDHPAYWVLGFLLSPDLAQNLLLPPEPVPQGPTISFDAPAGWKVKAVPFRLDLKKAKILGFIMVIEEFGFNVMNIQMAKLMTMPNDPQWAPPGLVAATDMRDVTFGAASGKKYVFRQSAPCALKQVDYLLSVPGGFVAVRLSAFVLDFDESPFESKLHTLRLAEAV